MKLTARSGDIDIIPSKSSLKSKLKVYSKFTFGNERR